MKKTRMSLKISTTIIVILLISVSGLGCIDEKTASDSHFEKSYKIVSTVIDGDTVRLEDGQKVRLLGINTPEMGQPHYEEAKNRLKELIEGKTVILEKDVEDKDMYGRLLRYIYCDDLFVNFEMIREGYAHVYIIFPNTRYSIEFEKAEKEAKKNGIGIWQKASHENSSKCIFIINFHFNAEGNDCYNLNDEYVTFKNICPQSIDMNGWTVKDEANHVYTFLNFSLEEGSEVTLFTGKGIDTKDKDTKAKLYWDSEGSKCGAIWNNDGDVLYLRDASDNLVIEYSYSGLE